MAQEILLHNKFCKMCRVYCLNYILNESQVNMKNTNFVTSLLRYNQSFLEWVQNKQIFLNPLQIIEIHNTGHNLPNKAYLMD